MKKLFVSIMILSIMASMVLLIYGEDEFVREESIIDQNLGKLFINNVDKTTLKMMLDKTNYSETMEGVSIEGNPIIPVYYAPLCGSDGYDFESYKEFAQKTYKKDCCDYIVFDAEKIYRIRVGDELNPSMVSNVGLNSYTIQDDPSFVPNYIADIKKMSLNQTICGVDCTVNDIICINNYPSYHGTAVYIFTDKGNFVKYYDNQNVDKATEYSEKDFLAFYKEYVEYLRDTAYDEEGNKLYRSQIGFNEFIEKYSAELDIGNDNTTKILIITACCVIVITLITIVVVKNRLKKINKNT